MNDLKLLKEKKKECKEANLTFINSIFILIFTIPVLLSITEYIKAYKFLGVFYLIMIIMHIIVAVILIYFFSLKRIIRNIKVRRHGRLISANVLAYCNDNYEINEKQAKIVLLETGEKDNNVIYYQLGETKERFEIDSKVELLAYKDTYLIKDNKMMRKDAILRSIVLTILSFVAIVYLAIIIVYFIMNSSFHEIRMANIQKKNKEIMTIFNDLEYQIPDNYKLITYNGNNFEFESKNDNHYCTIDIYRSYSAINKEKNGICDLSYGSEINSEEIRIINDTYWCYNGTLKKTPYKEKYYIYIGDYLYTITLNNHYEKDEKCSLDFNKFTKSLKFK